MRSLLITNSLLVVGLFRFYILFWVNFLVYIFLKSCWFPLGYLIYWRTIFIVFPYNPFYFCKVSNVISFNHDFILEPVNLIFITELCVCMRKHFQYSTGIWQFCLTLHFLLAKNLRSATGYVFPKHIHAAMHAHSLLDPCKCASFSKPMWISHFPFLFKIFCYPTVFSNCYPLLQSITKVGSHF